MRRYVLWLLPVGALAIGYVVGYFGASSPSTEFGNYSPFLSDLAVGVAVAVPAIPAAALLGSRPRWARALGLLALLAATYAAFVVGFFSWFGLCLDPGDVCQSTRATRWLTLLGAVCAIGVAIMVQRFRSRQTGRTRHHAVGTPD